MDTAILIEIFGYIGSALVVISMLMSSVVKLRVINTIGSVISGTYAVICGAFPLVLMNACLIVINLYNLFKLLKTEQKYELAAGQETDAFFAYFLERYREDIRLYFPEFKKELSMERVYYVFCEGTPAGILAGTEKAPGVLDVVLDYSTPAYRDCSVGRYLYGKLPGMGIHTLAYAGKESKLHASYLLKMGFVKKDQLYCKKLK